MLTVKEISTKITGVRTSASNLRNNLHVILMNLAGHVYEHGDVRPVESCFARLLDGSLKGIDVRAMVKYMQDNCFVHIHDKDGVISVALNKKAKREADFADGAAVVQHLTDEVSPWYEKAQSVSGALKDLNPAMRLRSVAKQIADTTKYKLVYSPSDFQSAQSELLDAIDARIREDNRVLATVSEIAEGRAIEDAQEAA